MQKIAAAVVCGFIGPVIGPFFQLVPFFVQGPDLGEIVEILHSVRFPDLVVQAVNMDTAAGSGSLRKIIEAIVPAVEIEIDKFALGRITHLQLRGDLGRYPVQQVGHVKGVCKEAQLPARLHAQNTLLLRQIHIIGAFLHAPCAVASSADHAFALAVLCPVRLKDDKLRLLGGFLGFIRIHLFHTAALGIQVHGRSPFAGKNMEFIRIPRTVLHLHCHLDRRPVFKAGHLISRPVGV